MGWDGSLVNYVKSHHLSFALSFLLSYPGTLFFFSFYSARGGLYETQMAAFPVVLSAVTTQVTYIVKEQ